MPLIMFMMMQKKVEHLLSEEKVKELELFLDHPTVDPHGKPIPGRGQV